jgi:SAM-dependent methyltransferase
MHPAAYEYVKGIATLLGKRGRVLDIGSRNTNGTVKPLFPGAQYVGLDYKPGIGADIVADAAKWRPKAGEPLFDTVVSTEVLEHTPFGKDICQTAYDVLLPGGVFILTAAGAGRPAHGEHLNQLTSADHYRNVLPVDLERWLSMFQLKFIVTNTVYCDIYATTFKL